MGSSPLLYLPRGLPCCPWRKEAFEKLKSDLPSGELLSESPLGPLCACKVIEFEMCLGLKIFE